MSWPASAVSRARVMRLGHCGSSAAAPSPPCGERLAEPLVSGGAGGVLEDRPEPSQGGDVAQRVLYHLVGGKPVVVPALQYA